MNEKFAVSIKGIICNNGQIILRKNQRKEYELIGGKLDIQDQTPQERLITEFKEEAGADIEVLNLRIPWLYIIGKKNVIIAPYVCELQSIDYNHIDEDGGNIVWKDKQDIDSLFLPIGYSDSICNRVPRTSFSPIEGDFLKIIPNYKETDYYVKVQVISLDGSILMDDYLIHNCSPIDLIKKKCKNIDVSLLYPYDMIKKDDTVIFVFIMY